MIISVMNQKDFFNVDWTKIPEPKLDVNLNHLKNFKISGIELNKISQIIKMIILKRLTSKFSNRKLVQSK